MTGDEQVRRRARVTPVVLETFGDFWCEAAVLVAVFGLLDEIMKHHGLTIVWAIEALSCAIVLLSLGTLLKIWARS